MGATAIIRNASRLCIAATFQRPRNMGLMEKE
jgi:hypothetical protein